MSGEWWANDPVVSPAAPASQAGGDWWKNDPVVGAPAGDKSAAVGRGIINGVPIVGPALLSGVNKGVAGIRSLTSGKPYAEELANVEGFSAATAKENPGSTTAGEIAGGVAGTLPAIAAAPVAFGVGAGGLAARTLASTATGGLIGGADTAARGGDASTGAAIGGGLGLVSPVAGLAVGKAVGALTGRTSGAERLLNRALQSDAITPEIATQRLAEMGPAGMVADLGPNLQRQAGGLAANPGKPQQIVREAIAERQGGAGARTVEATDAALGKPVDALATADELIARQREVAGPMYHAAYAKPLPADPHIMNVLKTPAGQKAVAQAHTLAANEGIPLGQDVRSMDLVKRAMDDMVETARRGGSNNEARVLGKLKDTLVGAVDAAVPEYAQARSAFAGHAALRDAFEAGQSVFSRQTTPGQLARTMQGMSDGEKELLQAGARSALADVMGTARNDALKARQTFDQGYNREKLGLLIGKPEAERLVGSLGDEAAFTRTRDVVTGNSETAARTAASAELGRSNGAKEGAIKSAFNMKFGDAGAALFSKATGGLSDAFRQRRNEDLARILVETGGDREGLLRAFAALGRSVRAKDLSGAEAQKLMTAVVQGGGQKALSRFSGAPAH